MNQDAAAELYKLGPFPNAIDLWAEHARYFQMIHASMIDALADQMQDRLDKLGYYAGRETSMQILEGRETDIFIRRSVSPPAGHQRLDYELAAAEVLAAVGEVALDEPAFEALHIRSHTGDLVTVVEIVSPANKYDQALVREYKERRFNLCLERGINVVEIDLSRSVLRLTTNPITKVSPYHVAVYLPGQDPRTIRLGFRAPFERIAIPLRLEAVAVELFDAYQRAYQRFRIARHVQAECQYAEDHLPFPSLLTDEQRAEALAAVKTWLAHLAAARPPGS